MSKDMFLGILIGVNIGLITGVVAFGAGIISGLKKAGNL